MKLNNKYKARVMSAFEFKQMVGDILRYIGYELQTETVNKEQVYDYEGFISNKKYIFEVKYYSSNVGIRSKLIDACKKILSVKKNDNTETVIIIGNIVEPDVRDEILKIWGINILDISNILYLVQEDEELDNKVRSLMEYAVQDIVLTEPGIPVEIQPKIKAVASMAKQYSSELTLLKSGKKYFSEYEKLCTEILKYLFSDYLSLWNKQLKSNDDLYRFDLCCKVKYGEVEEFFDSIRNFFNTEYIIFEFKNYDSPITQKEIYTTEKYLYAKALRGAAIILSRKGIDNNGMKAIKGSLREDGKLIISLSDLDLLYMLDLKSKGESAADYLTEKLDTLLLELEK